MADVFKDSEFNFGGAFPANKGIINTIGGSLTGTLMQNLGVNYAQQIQKIYELGKAGERTNVYYVGSRPSGSMQVGHILGPGVQLAQYFIKYSDVCQAGTNIIDLNLSGQVCGVGGNAIPVLSMKAKFCVLANVGFNVTSQQLAINLQSSVEFANLEYNGA